MLFWSTFPGPLPGLTGIRRGTRARPRSFGSSTSCALILNLT